MLKSFSRVKSLSNDWLNELVVAEGNSETGKTARREASTPSLRYCLLLTELFTKVGSERGINGSNSNSSISGTILNHLSGVDSFSAIVSGVSVAGSFT